MNYFPRLASSLDPPDLCLLSSKDYGCESPVPDLMCFFDSGMFTDGEVRGNVHNSKNKE
jgi:hypothetical protein